MPTQQTANMYAVIEPDFSVAENGMANGVRVCVQNGAQQRKRATTGAIVFQVWMNGGREYGNMI